MAKTQDRTTFVARFWRIVETRTTQLGIPVEKSDHYGLRPDDSVEFVIDDQPVRTTITDLWRTFCVKSGIEVLDLMVLSKQATAAGLILGSNRMGKPTAAMVAKGANPSKKVNYGLQFWTRENAVYQGRSTKQGTKASPEAIAKALGF